MNVKQALVALATLPEVKKMIEDVRSRGFEDVARSTGLVRGGGGSGAALGFFAFGAACGAIAAIVLSPRSGAAVRQDIAKAAAGVKEKVNSRRNGASTHSDYGSNLA